MDDVSKLNGVLQPLATAKVNSGKWRFSDEDSFSVEDGKEIFIGDTDFDCAAELAACEIHFGKVLSKGSLNYTLRGSAFYDSKRRRRADNRTQAVFRS